jgi:hypothetical protein
MKSIRLVIAVMFCVGPVFAAKESPDERAVWQLEQSYWNIVAAFRRVITGCEAE